MADLVNFGIVPLTFRDKQDYGAVAQGDTLQLDTKGLADKMCLNNATKKTEIQVELNLSERDKEVIRAGGKLAAVRKRQAK